MRRFMPSFPSRSCAVHYILNCLNILTLYNVEQEQGIAAQIVHVVIAGNSIEVPRGLLNGQVTHLYVPDNKAEYNYLMITYKL